ncbi:unnamed protein product [Orchesella dallaii]|uniref:WD repeat-containing protein 55 homolog n=1 Tax=Orchesella dallaii TaxID=48710 RepID=A0ABP1PRR2_9HEXA
MSQFKINFADILDVFPRPISCMRLQEKTKQLALYRGGDFGSIELWDVAHQPCMVKQLIDLELIDGKPSVESLVWAQGRLFSGGLHGFIVEHDLRSGKIKNKTAATSGPVWCLAVKSDESQIAAGTEDGFINIFDVLDESLIYLKVLDRQEGRVLCMDWSPCGNYIASGSVDSVRLWDVEKGHAIQRLITGRSKNKETIVWSIVMMENFTIASGDSRGIVSFWDGRVGVLKFKIISHKADILALKLSQDKTQLYAAGVDPTIIIMNKIINSDRWVKSHPRVMHTNDVMTLETVGNKLFSGGLDGDFIMSSFPPKVVTKIPPIPKQQFVFQSAEHVLVRKEASVNIWKLPTPTTELQMLLEFQTKGSENIYSTCLSPNGRIFAISTLKYIRVFRLNDVPDSPKPLQLTRLNLQDDEKVIANRFWHLNFLDDNRILALSVDGRKALFMQLSTDSNAVQITDCIAGPSEDEQSDRALEGIDSFIASVDGKHICVNCNNHISLYKVDFNEPMLEKMCSVPNYSARLTSMNFHPSHPLLLLTFSDHCFQVYNFERGRIIFQNKLEKKYDDQQPLMGSAWIRNGDAAVLFQVDGMYLLKLCTTDEPAKKSRKGENSSKSEFVRFKFEVNSCGAKYKYLAFMGSHNAGEELLAAEVNPNSLLEKLPPAFAKKRFGS